MLIFVGQQHNMIDPRFFKTTEAMTADQVCDLTGAAICQKGQSASLIARVADFSSSELSDAAVFLDDIKLIEKAAASRPALCFVSAKVLSRLQEQSLMEGITLLEAKNPRACWALLAGALHRSIAETEDFAVISGEAHQSSLIHSAAIIARSATIGENVRLGPGSFIGPGVVIGDGSFIGANVSVTHTVMGAGCHIIAGATIGEAGFGFVLHEGQQLRIPQLGIVEIGDEVEIGANTTVDRGTLSNTVIGDQTKIDNLVQVAHNVVMGKGCAIAGQTGISGSCRVGDRVHDGRAGWHG